MLSCLMLTCNRKQPGKEANWLNENMAHFKSEAYDHDDEDYKDLLQEIERRHELKAMIK